MLGRPSHVLRPLQPRCAAGSIRGTAPARWPGCKIRPAPSSQGLTYASASKDFLAPVAIAARDNIFTLQAVKHGRFAVPQQNWTCRFPASSSRTKLHAFTHGTSCPSLLRRTSPKCVNADRNLTLRSVHHGG